MATQKKTTRLSESDKNKIYKLFKQNNFTKQELAVHFNCSFGVVKNLVANLDSPLYHLRQQAKKAGTKDPVGYANEIWKLIQYPTKTKYEVSNLGRVRSYFPNPDKAVINRGVLQQGYLFLDYFNTKEDRRIKVPFHVLVAQCFVLKKSQLHNHAIHLDYKKTNNRATNLKWVTEAEMYEHGRQNPAAKAAREKSNAARTIGAKLTLTEVERIRKMLNDPLKKIKKKRIAIMFGVTEMTIYRIQSGEIWGSKGNHLPYQKKPIAKLDNDTVKKIRKRLQDKNGVQAAIAKEFGVSPTVIYRIKNELTYNN